MSDLLGHQQFLRLLEQDAGLSSARRGKLLELAPLLGHEHLLGLRHGRLPFWQQLIEEAPALAPSSTDFVDSVRIGLATDCSAEQRLHLEQALTELIPWRKGPFSLFGVEIDTEWRSDWKWDRLLPHISPLRGRHVLDVGCGNGYHCFRMLGQEAALVLGVEPHLPYLMQFAFLRHYTPHAPAFLLPATLDALPADLQCFDTVFSMGVLYHRRSPIDHLLELKACLRKGGELVLETLVVEGPEGYSLMPGQRYCRMGNVWFLPSCETVQTWLRRCGFSDIRLVDVNRTTTGEQRPTRWMPFQSLQDGLSPDDSSITIEGLPAPLRAIFIAST